MTSSHAGEFLTVQNVCIDNDNLLSMSINQVIDRYKEKMKLYMNEEILVQEQSSDIKTSGVVFTRGLKTNSPYYVITYDDQSGKPTLLQVARHAIQYGSIVMLIDTGVHLNGKTSKLNH